MDTNGNGLIDTEEFCTICSLGTETLYDDLDINCDGTIQFEELRSLFILADGTMDVSRVNKLLMEIRINLANVTSDPVLFLLVCAFFYVTRQVTQKL